MARLQTRTISRRTVETLKVEKDTVFWDSKLMGFGVRVYPSGSKYYVVQTRAGGAAAKRVTVGRHGVITAEEARRRAALIIARIKAGEEPSPETMASRLADGPTVAELAVRYMEEHVAVHCKPTTARGYRVSIENYILPEFGKLPALAVGQAHVAELHYRLRNSPCQANHVLAVLSRIFDMAESWGLVPEANNPCRFQVKYKQRPRERFLTEVEFRRLGRVLNEAETSPGVSARAVAAIRLLMLTGCRCNEILTLRWEEVDLEAKALHLSDSKTGPRTISLSPEAARVLAELPRASDNPWVITGRKPGAHLVDLQHPWKLICARAGLEGVRIHDLRHSFASRALALGESLPMIGKLLGHSRIETTARYAHLARDSVQESAARIADSIAADIMGGRWKCSGPAWSVSRRGSSTPISTPTH